MELFGAISAREWNSLNGIFSSDQEADYLLMAAHNFPANTTEALNYDHYHHPSTLLRASSLEFQFPFADSYLSSPCSYDQPVTWVTSNTSTLALSEQDIAIRNPDPFLNTKSAVENGSLLAGKPKKRSTSTISTVERDHDLELNNRRNFKQKKNKRLSMSDEEADDKEPISPNSSQEELEGLNSKGSVMALNLSGRARASKGSAMDPQSVYARKRREKINERLRTLQNLVPNGTKVDISTMLEEAVQYVKFLQLQIKLLSSDDLWIYAPLAYNGMNIGTDLRLSAPNQH